jgi:hypothetical protein
VSDKRSEMVQNTAQNSGHPPRAFASRYFIENTKIEFISVLLACECPKFRTIIMTLYRFVHPHGPSRGGSARSDHPA